MSSTFILMGLLVLAAFALGVLVGWLLGTSAGGSGDQPVRRPVRLRPMTRGLPDWDVEQTAVHPNGVEWTAAAAAGTTATDSGEGKGQGQGEGEVEAEADPGQAVETTMVLGPLANGEPSRPNPNSNPDPIQDRS